MKSYLNYQRFWRLARVAVIAILLCAGVGVNARAAQTVRIRISTTLGTITAILYADQAPVTVHNFLRYVDEGAFAGGAFVRTVRSNNQPRSAVKIAVIQALESETYQSREFAPIPLETTSETGLHHLDGTLSMAREAGVPKSATASFFICVGNQPSLDYGGKRNPDGQGFAAFGKVVEGMDVVRAIQRGHAEAQRLHPPIEILRIERL